MTAAELLTTANTPKFTVRVHRVGQIIGYRMGTILRCKGCLPKGPGWESISDSPAADGLWCDLCAESLEP